VTEPHSHFVAGSPRLHYLEWNPSGRRTIVLLHGGSANAWWWAPVAREMPPEFRLLALDNRGHGDSEWVRPPAYTPGDYANDVARLIAHSIGHGERPAVVGHSMGGLSALAFARAHPGRARGVGAIDIAVTPSRGRDRYIRRLKALPAAAYPDIETARERFRLMPKEGAIARELIHEIAGQSFRRTEEGRWTLKSDRECFLGGDRIHVLETIRAIEIPMLLVHAEKSRIMTADAAAQAHASNPRARLVTILDSHHHVLLERPAELARTIAEFAASV
jgi:pimeloyl-ACP methyl ester carboxylesterase